MLGVLFSILAGGLIAVQSIFNTRVSDKIGLFETTVVVHGLGLIASLIGLFLLGDGDFRNITSVNKLYLLGGTFGVFTVYGIMKGISLLGASYSVSILLVTQLLVSTFIDVFGLFGSEKLVFDYTKVIGIILMMAGIVVFKLKG